MTRRNLLLRPAAYALIVLSMGVAARADILEQYEFQGLPGTETSVAAGSVATGLGAVAFGETIVSPSGASNSISSTGWNKAGASYTFGLTINSGMMASINSLTFSSKSSATGPGVLNVLASVDGGAAQVVGSFTQAGSNFNDQILTLTQTLTALKSVAFSIVASSQVSAGGGTIGATGTFRIGDYNPSGTPTPFTIGGTFAPTPSVAVPEPASILLATLGLIGVWAAPRSRRVRSAARG